MSVKEYDPDMIDVLVSGAPLSGFQEDSIIEVEFDDDDFQMVKGVDGDVTRSRVIARTATVTIKLLNTSRSNAVLSAIRAQGAPGTGTADVFAFMLRDRNGASVLATDTAWIMHAPGISHSGKANARDWKLTLVKPTMLEAGV